MLSYSGFYKGMYRGRLDFRVKGDFVKEFIELEWILELEGIL